MENSFKASAAYDRVVLPDGTIEITYNDVLSFSGGMATLGNVSLLLGIPHSLLFTGIVFAAEPKTIL